ncbi:MAG: cation transporter [Bacilli bacterium]|nr:cation transporter [Bacilli bacterium]
METKPINREKTIIRTSIIGIIANILLVGFKAFVGFIAGSISIVMDALNNLTDALSSIITIIGTKLSNKKPDRKHPFGHGRVEYITSTIIAVLILFAGGVAIYESIVSIVEYFTSGDKTLPSFAWYSLVIIGVAILVKIGIGIFYKIQGKKVQSEALKASGTDALFDAILSTATLVGAIFAVTLHWYVEGYLGIIIGLFIIKSGIDVLRESFSSIIGERHDPEETKNMLTDISSVPGVKGAYDLIIHSYGPNKYVGSVHIGVDSGLSAKEIQIIERNIAALMASKYNMFMTVGIYADNVDSKLSKEIRSKIQEFMKNNPNILQMHGFFVDEIQKFCNFDLVFSFNEKEPEQRIEEIRNALQEAYPDMTFYIQLDRDYSLS